MKKEIEFEGETIQIEANLSIDHSEVSGMLHELILTIPSYGDNRVYGKRRCNTNAMN